MDRETHIFPNRHRYWQERHALSSEKVKQASEDAEQRSLPDQVDSDAILELSTLNLQEQQKAISEQIRHCLKCGGKDLNELLDHDDYLLGKTCANCEEFMPTVDDTVSLQELKEALALIQAQICDNCDNADVYQYTFAKLGKEDKYHIHCEKCGSNIPIENTDSALTSQYSFQTHQSGLQSVSDSVSEDEVSDIEGKTVPRPNVSFESRENSFPTETSSGTSETKAEKAGWYDWSKNILQRFIVRGRNTRHPTERAAAAKKSIGRASEILAALIPHDYLEQVGLDPRLVPLKKVIAVAGEQIYAAVDDVTNSKPSRHRSNS